MRTREHPAAVLKGVGRIEALVSELGLLKSNLDSCRSGGPPPGSPAKATKRSG